MMTIASWVINGNKKRKERRRGSHWEGRITVKSSQKALILINQRRRAKKLIFPSSSSSSLLLKVTACLLPSLSPYHDFIVRG
jgi:hypothetical protein